jgi:hypothetical protein
MSRSCTFSPASASSSLIKHFSATMSRTAVGGSNHLSSRYCGSFLRTKKPGREANHAPPSSVVLEMCPHHRPHISWHVVFVKHRGMYISIPCLEANPDRSVSMSVCQKQCSSNSHSTGTWKIREVCSKIHRLLPIFIVAMASVLYCTEVLNRTLCSDTGYPESDMSCFFSALSYEYSGYCIKSIQHVYIAWDTDNVVKWTVSQ